MLIHFSRQVLEPTFDRLFLDLGWPWDSILGPLGRLFDVFFSRLTKSQIILLALINKGMLRQKAYSIVQKCSKEALKNNYSFEDILKKNSIIKKY